MNPTILPYEPCFVAAIFVESPHWSRSALDGIGGSTIEGIAATVIGKLPHFLAFDLDASVRGIISILEHQYPHERHLDITTHQQSL
jgi:hypothetical protein